MPGCNHAIIYSIRVLNLRLYLPVQRPGSSEIIVSFEQKINRKDY